MLTQGILEAYCAIDRARIDDVVLRAAKLALADGLAVMVAATGLEPATQRFTDYALSSGHGPSSLIGMPRKVSAVHAALANGALAHAIDFEDTFEEGMIHPNASLIPAVLALAESEGIDERSTLFALALGCDFSCRLSLAIDGDPAQLGWYHPPILSGLGATLGCSVLLRLDAVATNDALGLFAAQFMLTDELKRSPNSDLRAVREGFAARAAVEAALLARAGVRGVEKPLEGQSGVFRILTGKPPLRQAFEGIGSRYWGPEVGIKRWPACRGTHSAILLAQRLKTKQIPASEIARIGVKLSPPNDMLFTPRTQRIAPSTPIDAKFSIPFVLAVTLQDGAISLSSFSQERLTDPAILALTSRVHLDETAAAGGHEAEYRVQLNDGSIVAEIIADLPVWRARDIDLYDLAGKVGECFGAGTGLVDAATFLSRMNEFGDAGPVRLSSLLWDHSL
ncbi:MmgE/PrpD family protein [Pelagibacterium limicola]|uniref:MmgE/PrpD family protein n=1 Tax=Pelagibacterium limicola TaxID=2791022 RepID=UPI0024841CF5|nr:MmgE/PrpD family protein [Pelagibacterium limicola]